MTEPNRKENIREELRRGRESFASAEILAASGQFGDAVSRMYYFLFHSARALLLSKGLEARSHEGLLRMLGLHFVKTEILTPQDSHVVTRLMKYREEADYNPFSTFSKPDYESFRTDALAFDQKVADYLRSANFLL